MTLDRGVERILCETAARTRKPFKKVLNDALRVGIEQSMSIGPPEPFVLKARAMGLRAGHDPAGFNQLADDLEAEAFLESTSEIPKMRPDFLTDRYGFIVDYLAEVMREMRKRSFSDVINKYFNVSGLFSGANK